MSGSEQALCQAPTHVASCPGNDGDVIGVFLDRAHIVSFPVCGGIL
jgi:hypothetical protein